MIDNQHQVIFTDNLKIKFEGDNTIDFQQLFGYLAGIEAAYQASLDVEYHSPSMNLKVVAINEGSFEISLQSVVALVPDLIKAIPSTVSTFKILMEMIQIKQELYGKKPQSIVANGDLTKIVNAEGEAHYHNSTVVNYYFNNPQIDAGMSKAFSALSIGNNPREAICLSSANETMRIEKEIYPSISIELINEPISKDYTDSSTIIENLRIAKLDFVGDTMWSFIDHNKKKITASIEDEQFLTNVRNGKIKLSANAVLKTRLRIETELNDYSDTIRKRYYVEEVIGTSEIPKQEQTIINFDEL